MRYGVLRGRYDRAKREDGAATPHLQIRVLDASSQAWRIAVNVESSVGAGAAANLAVWIVDPLQGHPILDQLAQLPSGFSDASADDRHGLDYVKAPAFEWSKGRRLPPSGQGSEDDLQDLLLVYLNALAAAGGDLYAFGAKFESNLHKPIDQEFGNLDGLHGIHDIHLNQGSPEAAHRGDNGVFHDGGLLLRYPDRVVGVFLGFQNQRVPTDAGGQPLPTSRSLGELLGGGPPPPPPPAAGGDVYIERALLNPSGVDAGHEIVVLGNLGVGPVDLKGWQLADRNDKRAKLTGLSIAGGASVVVALSGLDMQLANGGGTIRLLNAAGNQVHAVSYSAADASREGRFVRF